MTTSLVYASSPQRRVCGVLLAAVIAATIFALPTFAAGGITVTTAADTISTDGHCTLREALANANSDSDTTGGDCAAGSGNDLIEFAPSLAGQTITLAGAELVISHTVTLNGPGAGLLAISGGNNSRVFNITGGAVKISGLTISDGRVSSAHGGGINNSGALTLDHVVVVSNTIATGSSTTGGGIYNSGALTVTHSAIISNANHGSNGRGGGLGNVGAAVLLNSTIGLNYSNSFGGGIFNTDPGALTSTFTTIVQNTAAGFQGGGISQQGLTSQAAFQNTLLADNTANGNKDDCHYLLSAPVSHGYNLVESAGSCPFNATGDIKGQDPKLGPLTDNGGPTPTRALLSDSPAAESIPLNENGCGSSITTDQRDFMRVNACSIGAVEHKGVWLTLQKSVDADTPAPTQTITYTLVAALAAYDDVSVSNLLISDALPAGLNFIGPVAVTGGSGGSDGPPPVLVSGLTLAGGQAVTVTFPVTVSAGQPAGTLLTNTAHISSSEWPHSIVASHRLTISNIAPVAAPDTLLVLEDSGITNTQVVVNDYDLNGDVLTPDAVGAGSSGGITGISAGVITYAPALNFIGVEVFTYTISDGDLSATAAVTVNVTAVNDAPSFSGGEHQLVLQGSGPQSVPGWATAISPGPANEAGQSLTFTLSSDNPALFAAQPSLSSDGQLTFAPNAGLEGSAVVTVTLQDSGGVAWGGVDTSAPQTFTINIVRGDELSEVTPAGGGSLAYSNPSAGENTSVQVPGGAVTQSIRLVYDELAASNHQQPAGYSFAGRFFTLEAYQNGNRQADYQFAAPITLTLSYSPNPAALNYADETTLELRYWNGSAWDSSGITLLNRDLLNHRLTVRLNHLSEYALVGIAPMLTLTQQVTSPQPNPMPGSIVTYTLAFSNDGSLPASGLVVSQSLPAGLTFKDWITQGGAAFNTAGALLTWGPHTLPAHTPVTVHFTALISPSVAISNTVLTSTARYSSTNAGSGAAETAFTTSFYYVKYFPIIFKESAP